MFPPRPMPTRAWTLVGASGVNGVRFRGGKSKVGNRASYHTMGNNKSCVALISFQQLNIYRSLCPESGRLAGAGPCSRPEPPRDTRSGRGVRDGVAAAWCPHTGLRAESPKAARVSQGQARSAASCLPGRVLQRWARLRAEAGEVWCTQD